jgi:hypothetical protein
LGGKPFWIKKLTAQGWATLLAWLDDRQPGRDDPRKLPKFNSDESKALLLDGSGQAVLAWLALRDQGLDYLTASNVWFSASEAEIAAAMTALLGRRKTYEPDDDNESDISDTWLSKGMAQMAMEYGLAELGQLNFDQIDWLMSSGECDSEYSRKELEAMHASLPERIALIERLRAEQEAAENGTT